MYKPVESRGFPENKINFSLCNEQIAEVTDFIYEPYYSKLNISGAISKCYMRKGVCERLKLAESYLPKGLRFKIYDAWRPFEVQLSLYNAYRRKVERENSGLSDEEIDKLTKLFVSMPTRDELMGPVHATGGAIDLTIVDCNGKELDMGTKFDFFGDMANTDYFEKNDVNPHVRENRRILYHVMTKAGFTNLPTEWWHYDYGNRFYAYYSGKSAVYGCVFK